MRLVLAIVVERGTDYCHVRMLAEPITRRALYTEPFRPRAESIGPGCLVALDVATEPPSIAWRWFPATVLALEDERVLLDEPFHGVVDAAPCDPAPTVGEIVYITTGLSDGWRVDAGADAPERAAAALPQIEELYARLGLRGGRGASPDDAPRTLPVPDR